MPFRLCNAPETFQRLLETVLAGLKCVDYQDDILVMGNNFEEHLDNFTEVLQKLKPNKCQEEYHVFIYFIFHDGITTHPEKVKSIRNFPTPANIKQLRSLLRLVSCYRRFINGFSKTICSYKEGYYICLQ